MIFSISLFEIISVFVLDTKMFFSINASDADTAAVNVIKKLLADGLIKLLIQSNLIDG